MWNHNVIVAAAAQIARLRTTDSATLETRAAEVQFVTTAQPGTNVKNERARAALTGPSTPRPTRAPSARMTASEATSMTSDLTTGSGPTGALIAPPGLGRSSCTKPLDGL